MKSSVKIIPGDYQDYKHKYLGREVTTDRSFYMLNEWLFLNLAEDSYFFLENYNLYYSHSAILFFKREEDYNLFMLTFKNQYIHHYEI